MRTLNKNKQILYYALQIGEQPVYELDLNGDPIIDYVDEEGNIYYRETGETEIVYSEPVKFFASLSMSGGEAEAQEFGLSISDYNATLLTAKGDVPLTEGSLIWHKSEIVYKNIGGMVVDAVSADYVVLKVSESLNFVKYVLKAVVK